MRAVDLIRRKRDGGTLSAAEVEWLIRHFLSGEIPDYQMSALLMAIFFRGCDGEETRALTQSMLHSGQVLRWNDGRPVGDKHSTGGVGDKTSLILAPLAACFDVLVPMISGRGLGHTGGTLDKLESIPGFRTRMSLEEFRACLEQTGCGMIGATAEIAPADRRLYALRDVTATVENPSLITASILSKKLAEGLDALVLDVKTGSGAFLRDADEARRLAVMMAQIGGEMGVRVEALLTDMDQPLGACIGNALEVLECREVMHGGGPADLVELTVELTARLVALCYARPATALEQLRSQCRQRLADGSAWQRFCRMAVAQGADRRALDHPEQLPQARATFPVRAGASGVIGHIDARRLGEAAMLLERAGLARKIPSTPPWAWCCIASAASPSPPARGCARSTSTTAAAWMRRPGWWPPPSAAARPSRRRRPWCRKFFLRRPGPSCSRDRAFQSPPFRLPPSSTGGGRRPFPRSRPERPPSQTVMSTP